MTALFLDRDGVINQRIVDGYVTRPDDFLFIDGVLQAMAIFARNFDRIFVVTNQQGIGKGLMTEADLAAVHAYMLQQVQDAGGRIDRIYVCTAVDEDDPRRKPNTGMVDEIRADFPDIDLRRSILVGDSPSDMLFARRAGIPAVQVMDSGNLLTFARRLTN